MSVKIGRCGQATRRGAATAEPGPSRARFVVVTVPPVGANTPVKWDRAPAFLHQFLARQQARDASFFFFFAPFGLDAVRATIR